MLGVGMGHADERFGREYILSVDPACLYVWILFLYQRISL